MKEDLKTQYIKHRLELSEELAYRIEVGDTEIIKELKEQIEKLDEIIKVFFNS